MLYFIQYFSDFCASFSYYVANNIKTNVFYSASDIFAYANIYIVIFLLCINPALKDLVDVIQPKHNKGLMLFANIQFLLSL